MSKEGGKHEETSFSYLLLLISFITRHLLSKGSGAHMELVKVIILTSSWKFKQYVTGNYLNRGRRKEDQDLSILRINVIL